MWLLIAAAGMVQHDETALFMILIFCEPPFCSCVFPCFLINYII